jgi:hypothetical protein
MSCEGQMIGRNGKESSPWIGEAFGASDAPHYVNDFLGTVRGPLRASG